MALHQEYPRNKSLLAAKTGAPPEHAYPREIPGLQDRPAKAAERQNCIHCHMVKEFAMRAKWEEGRLSASDLYVYPVPERVGLTIDVNDGLLVRAVAEDSPAAAAGIARGDELVSLAGQPLISMADIRWVLHNSSDEVELPATLRRDGETLTKTLSLSGDWKKSDFAWRASSWYGLRQGVKLDPVPDSDGLALAIKGLYGDGPDELRKAGARLNDVIVGINGKTDPMTVSEFLAYLRLEHGPDDTVELTIRRGDRRLNLTVPLW